MNPLQLAGLLAALGAPSPAHRQHIRHLVFHVHCTAWWFHHPEHRSCALRGSFSSCQLTPQTRSTDVGVISSLLWGQVIEGWPGARKPQGFLKILSSSIQTQPENSQRSIRESKILNKVAPKPLTKPILELPYTDSIVFSTSKIEGEKILFPQRQRVCLQTRQCSWAWAHPMFASALRWSSI